MSEQEDIDSDYLPDSEHGTMISERDMGEDLLYSSNSGMNEAPLSKESNGLDSDSDSDLDSNPDSDSDSESEEEYTDNRVKARKGKDGDTDCSPTSDSEMVTDGSGGVGESSKTGKRGSITGSRKVTKKGSFFNKLFGGKNRKNKTNNPLLLESDIEHSESHSEASNTKNQLNPNGGAESSTQANSTLEGSLPSKSSETDRSRALSANAAHDSSSVNSGNNQTRSKKQAQEDRRKKYEGTMHRVTEEEADDIERSFVANQMAPLTPPGQVKKRVESINETMKENVRKNSFDSGSSLKKKKRNSVHSRSSRKKNRSVEKSNVAGVNRVSPDPPDKTEERTKKTKQKNKPISSKNLKAHPAASAARNHGNTVTTRIDYTGQIVPSSFNEQISSSSSINYLPNRSSGDLTGKVTNGATGKLSNEVHRLRKLVELMMTRMELYEKQSECLVETSLDHNRQWKKATIEIHDLQKREYQNPTDEKLADIKNLLIERSVQEKWIHQMEGIQRGYQDRLTATDKQLKVLRYAHVKTSKQIFNMRKSNNASVQTTPENSNSTRYKDMNELKTPKARNIPLARWTGEINHTSGTTAALPTLPIDPKDAVGNTQDSKNAFKVDGKNDPDGKKELTQGQLLAEMIVSFHTTSSDMSPLSDRGKLKDDSKKKKDKKKKKKRKEEVGAIL